MASSDDEVREIHLSGKQLVFLFMAVTVVSVVIFLCGVLVGRGVQSRATVTSAAATTPAPDEADDPTTPVAPVTAPPTEPTKATGLGYQEILEGKTPPPDKLKSPSDPAPATPAPAAATKTPPRTEPTAQTAAPAATPAPAAKTPTPKDTPSLAFPEPRGDGFAIQVAALTGRGEAESVANRLKGKGYAVYLVSALPGQPASFKVRVGKFKARADAEKVATRLEREEQFKPWITR